MIESQEALKLIRNHNASLGLESCLLKDSHGRILAEDVVADRDFPPFNRVSMDGIAIDYSAYESGQRKFSIEGIQAAGDIQRELKNKSGCLEVMTGAVCPKGTETVIQYEHLLKDGEAFIIDKEVQKAQNVHSKGLDRKSGDLLIRSGTRIGIPEISVLASVGISEPRVYKQARIAILSTGNELVEVEENPGPHQIRKSNIWVLQTALERIGCRPSRYHVQDDQAEIEQMLETLIKKYDLLILSGGVSKGKFDFIPEVLQSIGVKEIFHRIAQRPGKPLWFGSNGSCTVFGLPGNPVSTLVCYLKYVQPWIIATQHAKQIQNERIQYAELLEDVTFKPDLHYFMQVQLVQNEAAQMGALPIQGKGSGDLANLLEVDGFLELPKSKTNFKKGEVYPYLSIR